MITLKDLQAVVTTCFSCLRSPSLSINGRDLNIVKLLGEGGFSYVYLVEDLSGEQYALKKIRCPFDTKAAMREVEASRIFSASPLVVSLVDSTVRQEADGTKTVYILLPYYAHGTLQDKINAVVMDGDSIPETEVRQLFDAACRSLRVMHRHRTSGPVMRSQFLHTGEQDRLLDSLDSIDDADVPGIDDDGQVESLPLGEMVPWAHRDVKPANFMLTDQDRSVLMDLGSAAPARVTVETREQALLLQDQAAELCTLPYRAPELLNVDRGKEITEKVDIWSLGCTIFALMYGISPFEREERASGANLTLAILGSKFQFPETPEYSAELKSLVADCLKVDPQMRPTVDDILDRLEQMPPV